MPLLEGSISVRHSRQMFAQSVPKDPTTTGTSQLLQATYSSALLPLPFEGFS